MQMLDGKGMGGGETRQAPPSHDHHDHSSPSNAPAAPAFDDDIPF
jgi:hypothetical protein